MRPYALLILALPIACSAPSLQHAVPAAPSAISAPIASAAPTPQATAAPLLPAADNTEDLIPDVPTLTVSHGDVLLDGERVDDARLFDGNDALHRMDGVFNTLKARREAWKAAHPGSPLPGVVFFRFEPDLKAAIAKSVFQTAAFAAYPFGSFVVRVAGTTRVGRINADAFVPPPPGWTGPPIPDEPRLHVKMEDDHFELRWQMSPGVEYTTTAPRREARTRDEGGEILRYPDLAAAISAAWREHGAHHEPADPKFDQLSISVDNRAPFQVVIAMLDAAYAPTRSALLDGKMVTVPSFNATLSMP